MDECLGRRERTAFGTLMERKMSVLPDCVSFRWVSDMLLERKDLDNQESHFATECEDFTKPRGAKM